jgi:hypothetical protein
MKYITKDSYPFDYDYTKYIIPNDNCKNIVLETIEEIQKESKYIISYGSFEYLDCIYLIYGLERVPEISCCVPCVSLLDVCNKILTNRISSCTTGRIKISNTLDMSQNLIINENAWGYRLYGNDLSLTGGVIYVWRNDNTGYLALQSNPQSAFGNPLSTNNNFYFKFTTVESYGGAQPEYVTEANGVNVKLKIPFNGLYSITFNSQVSIADNNAIGIFISRNVGQGNDVIQDPTQIIGWQQITTFTPPNLVAAAIANLSSVIRLNANDYLNFCGFRTPIFGINSDSTGVGTPTSGSVSLILLQKYE